MIFSTIFSNILLFIQAIACLANNNSFMSPINSPVLNELEQEKNYTFDITNLQDSYSINDQISFSLSTENISSVDNTSKGLDNVKLRQTGKSDWSVELEVDDQDSSISLFAEDEEGKTHSTDIYFYKTEDTIYTSTASIDYAYLKKIKDDKDNGLLSELDYDFLKNNIYGSFFDSDVQIIAGPELTIEADLKWKDANGKTHPIAFTKVALLKVNTLNSSPFGYTAYITKTLVESYTDEQGHIKFNFQGSAFTLDNLFQIRCYTEGINTSVVDMTDNEVYQSNSEIFNMGNNYNVSYSPIFDDSTDVGKAFQVSQTLIHGAEYAKRLNNGNDISTCKLVMNTDTNDGSAFYAPATSSITLDFLYKDENATSALPFGYQACDVILHEYSHHIQNYFGNIDDSPGGQHYINTNNADDRVINNHPTASNKLQGLHLAWGEGWATFNSQIIQDYCEAYFSTVPFGCDSRYTAHNGVDYSLLDYRYRNYDPTGEANECAVSQILYKLVDERTDAYDKCAFDDLFIWEIIHDNSVKTFSEFISALYEYCITYDRTVMGKLLALHNVAPSNLKIISGGDSSNTPPTFSWNGNGGSIYFPNDKFYLGFVYNDRQDLFVTSEISSTTYTLTKLEWMNINSLCNGSYQVYVIAYSSAYYETGPFYSELFEFDLPSN